MPTYKEESARIYDDAKMYDNSAMYGNSRMYNNSKIYHNAVMQDNAIMYNNSRMYDNAKLYDDAIMYGNSILRDNSRMRGDSQLFGNAVIRGDGEITKTSDYITLGPAISSERFTTAHKDRIIGIRVNSGCFSGTLEEFAAAIEETHADNFHALRQYRGFVACIKAHFGLED